MTNSNQAEENLNIEPKQVEIEKNFSSLWSGLSQKAKKVATQLESTTKEILNRPQVQEFGSNLKKQAGEIKQKIESGEIEENLRSGFDQAGKTINQAVSNAKTTASQTATTISAKTLEWRKQQAIGKFLTIDLKNIDDLTIAKRGDVITRDIINKAEAQNLLENVLEFNQEEHPGII